MLKRKKYEKILNDLGYLFDTYASKKIADDIFVYDEAIRVLDLNLEYDKKIELLRLTNKPISVLNKNYSDKLIIYILVNNFDKCDAEYLYQNYSKYCKVVRDAIYQVAEERTSNILDGNYVDFNSDILVRSRCDIDEKIQL